MIEINTDLAGAVIDSVELRTDDDALTEVRDHVANYELRIKTNRGVLLCSGSLELGPDLGMVPAAPEDRSTDRLQEALLRLGYGPTKPVHHRFVLIQAIMVFAATTEDSDLEEACEREIARLRVTGST